MSTERTAPSSKIIALGIIVLSVVVAAWLIKSDEQRASQEAALPAPVIVERTPLARPDTDGDGLPDWEEFLWHFDPNNPDTDGDGIGDAEEQRAVEEELSVQESDFAALLDPRNNPEWESLPYTDQVSDLFIAKYLSAKQDGAPLSQEEAYEIIRDIPRYELPPRTAPRTYALSDIETNDASGASALYDYGNEVGEALTDPTGGPVPNELAALVAFMQGGSSEAFVSTVRDIVLHYDVVIDTLLEIPVPKDIAVEHVEIINALSAVRNDLSYFESFEQDPFLALSVFTSYNENSSRRGLAFDALRAAFLREEVVFSQTDPGFLLTRTSSSL